MTPLSAEPGVDDVTVALPPAAAAGRPIGGKLNLIQEAIAIVKTITGHPLTWLAVLLAVFGGAAAGVVRYRAYKERRRGRLRAGQQRRGSLDATRGHRHIHPTGAESLPRHARSSAKSGVERPGMRRASKQRRSL